MINSADRCSSTVNIFLLGKCAAGPQTSISMRYGRAVLSTQMSFQEVFEVSYFANGLHDGPGLFLDYPTCRCTGELQPCFYWSSDCCQRQWNMRRLHWACPFICVFWRMAILLQSVGFSSGAKQLVLICLSVITSSWKRSDGSGFAPAWSE